MEVQRSAPELRTIQDGVEKLAVLVRKVPRVVKVGVCSPFYCETLLVGQLLCHSEFGSTPMQELLGDKFVAAAAAADDKKEEDSKTKEAAADFSSTILEQELCVEPHLTDPLVGHFSSCFFSLMMREYHFHVVFSTVSLVMRAHA